MKRAFRSPPRRAALSALAVLLLSATALSATTLLRLDDDQLVDQSSRVVVGTCTAVHTEWRRGMLMTLASVRVDRVLKGEPVSEVTVMIPGGTDFERPVPVAVTFPGAPSILPDERTLLFLEPAGTGSGELSITGFSQGKFSILVDPDGTEVVRRDLRGVAVPRGHRLSAGGLRTEPLARVEERILRRVAADPHETAGTPNR